MRKILVLLNSIAGLCYRVEPNFLDHTVLIDDAKSSELSFIDSIFGELVNDEKSLRYKKALLASGDKSLYSEKSSEANLEELFNQMQESDLGTFSEILQEYHINNELNQEQRYFDKAHEGFKRYKSQINYPDKDDTSDMSDSAASLFGGIVSFAHFPYFNCFNPKYYDKEIDIAIVGAPFDTGTSYRPGARFGPNAIRSGSKRLGLGSTPVRGNTKDSPLYGLDPYDTKSHNLTLIDCGDVPMTPFDNRIALNQLYRGIRSIYNHPSRNAAKFPKIITLGGDHTITLLTIKAAYERYGKITVLHFDSHIDTWDPKVLGGGITHYMSLNHGTFLHYASEQGYLTESNFHIGLRAPYISPSYDKKHDIDCGFHVISARDLDNFGRDEIIKRIKETVGDGPLYISVDIDVLDPANAPGTGTMEIGGFTGRELLSLLDGLSGVNLIGADVVEVSPPYDSNSEITSLAATAVIDSFLGLLVVNEIS
ncbi:uncharacterized protein PRCAT00002586001 [Priceomyces carsonii]|uniref:uncharacterized protein n=1 Tax=Priceomyces carsonii TaxID=28549 RepID=UPI002ED81C4D|nr:unnamed protein product [Priceomyces carsonii]